MQHLGKQHSGPSHLFHHPRERKLEDRDWNRASVPVRDRVAQDLRLEVLGDEDVHQVPEAQRRSRYEDGEGVVGSRVLFGPVPVGISQVIREDPQSHQPQSRRPEKVEETEEIDVAGPQEKVSGDRRPRDEHADEERQAATSDVRRVGVVKELVDHRRLDTPEVHGRGDDDDRDGRPSNEEAEQENDRVHLFTAYMAGERDGFPAEERERPVDFRFVPVDGGLIRLLRSRLLLRLGGGDPVHNALHFQ
eukprot:CAMPEP_0114508824 /NCGR_PEP_ID=MMETSP0109-20121206/12840_1 /TAXON_ID=29199 /ORGANISM="Chlorarachnion reptans, Strain CCCM449" /LENGTH=247 /DNA_ID=CAMNT_0001687851 /DNA_START=585 /DNA_END=1328 /DNA_ORIENTATION=+